MFNLQSRSIQMIAKIHVSQITFFFLAPLCAAIRAHIVCCVPFIPFMNRLMKSNGITCDPHTHTHTPETPANGERFFSASLIRCVLKIMIIFRFPLFDECPRQREHLARGSSRWEMRIANQSPLTIQFGSADVIIIVLPLCCWGILIF